MCMTCAESPERGSIHCALTHRAQRPNSIRDVGDDAAFWVNWQTADETAADGRYGVTRRLD